MIALYCFHSMLKCQNQKGTFPLVICLIITEFIVCRSKIEYHWGATFHTDSGHMAYENKFYQKCQLQANNGMSFEILLRNMDKNE